MAWNRKVVRLVEEMSGEALVTAAALLAIQVAQGKSVEQLELLAAFFTVLADNLALIAGQIPIDDSREGVV